MQENVMQAILAEFRSLFHLQFYQDNIPIEDTLQGGKEMCVKTEWQQYFIAQTQDYFIEILTGNSWILFPFSIARNFRTLQQFYIKLIVLTKRYYYLND